MHVTVSPSPEHSTACRGKGMDETTGFDSTGWSGGSGWNGGQGAQGAAVGEMPLVPPA